MKAKTRLERRYFFVLCLEPLIFDRIMDIAANIPSPNINMVNNIELAILIAAREFILYLATTRISVAPIKVCPRFPINKGKARINNSVK